MISKKVFEGDGSNNRFLSDFIIRSEQFTRVYNYMFDPEGIDGTVHANGLFIRVTDYPTSDDLQTINKWDLVDNSISFYVAPLAGSRIYIEVATTPEEFGDTLVQPAIEKAEEAAAAALVSEVAAETSAAAALVSETGAASSAAAAVISKDAAYASKLAAEASQQAAFSSEGNAATSAAAALVSKNAAATSASEALASENAAGNSETAAAGSAGASAASAAAALVSEQNAATSAATLPTLVGGTAYKFLTVNAGETGYDFIAPKTAFNRDFGTSNLTVMEGDFISERRRDNGNEGSTTQDPDTTLYPFILTSHTNCPATGFWHIKTQWYSTINTTASCSQIAVEYSPASTTIGARVFARSRYGEVFTAWVQIGGEEKWITPTLQNGWVNYAPTFSDAGYKKDSAGNVHIRLFVKDGSGAVGDTIFLLPEGYRPPKSTIISALNAGVHITYYVNSGGTITPSAAFTPGAWVSLNFTFNNSA